MNAESAGETDSSEFSSDDESLSAEEISYIYNDRLRYCWICFDDDKEDEWIQPCRCNYVLKWVHQSCLQLWIDYEQRKRNITIMCCPLCKAEYIYAYPPVGRFTHILEAVDKMADQVCPVAAKVLLGVSLYWTSVLYGGVTVWQCLGYQDGMNFLKEDKYITVLLAFPCVPVILISSKMIEWENFILKQWRKHWKKIPFLNKLLGANSKPNVPDAIEIQPTPPVMPSISDPEYSHTSVFSALMLPTLATVFGRVFYSSVSCYPVRVFLGGFTFIAIKGVLKMYLYQQRYAQLYKRKALNSNYSFSVDEMNLSWHSC